MSDADVNHHYRLGASVRRCSETCYLVTMRAPLLTQIMQRLRLVSALS